MLTDHPPLPAENVSDPKSQVALQKSAELERTYGVQIHEIVDALAAATIMRRLG